MAERTTGTISRSLGSPTSNGRYSTCSELDQQAPETGLVAARLRAFGQNGRQSPVSRPPRRVETIDKSMSASASNSQPKFDVKQPLPSSIQLRSRPEEYEASQQKHTYLGGQNLENDTAHDSGVTTALPTAEKAQGLQDSSRSTRETEFRQTTSPPSVVLERFSDYNENAEDAQYHLPEERQPSAPTDSVDKRGWRQAVRANASARIVASQSPKSSPKPQTEPPFELAASSQYSTASPEEASKVPDQRQSPWTSNPFVDRGVSRSTRSVKSSIGSEIASMISSALEGRSESGSVHLEQPPRPFSRQFAPGRPSTELKQSVYRPKSSLSTGQSTSNPQKQQQLGPPVEPVTSSYKMSSPNPVVHPGSSRQSNESKLSKAYDRLDGYQFYPEPSPMLNGFPPKPKTVPATPASAYTAQGSSFHDHTSSKNSLPPPRSPQDKSMPPPMLPPEPRFEVYLRERTDIPASAPRTPSPTRGKTHSPKQALTDGQRSGSPDKPNPSPLARSPPPTPNPPNTTPVSGGGQQVSDGIPGWRWWKLIRSGGEAGAQGSDEESPDEEGVVPGNPRALAGRDPAGSGGKWSLDSQAHGAAAERVVKKRSAAPNVRSAEEERRFDGEGESGDEGFEADTESVRMDGSSDGLVDEAGEGGKKVGLRPRRDSRKARGSGMQVVIELEEDDSGRVYVEVTPSPKGRKKRERRA